jgi:large subunit ribosomal protein L30
MPKSKSTQPKTEILRIKLIKSPIGYSKRHKATIRALGLRRMNQVVEHPDTPTLRGMLNKVNHLVKTELLSE